MPQSPNQGVVLNVPNEGQAGRYDRKVPDPQQRTVFRRVGTPSEGVKRKRQNAMVYQFCTGYGSLTFHPL
jgi:hypothetical protein